MKRLNLISLATVTALVAACAASEDNTTQPQEPSDETETVDGGADAGQVNTDPLYALQFLVYGANDEAMTYVVLTDTLDMDGITLDNAHEFPGYASIAAVGGKLLVSDGDGPEITRFEIGPNFTWSELETISFANRGLTGVAATYFEKHWFVDEHAAYVTLDVTSRVAWDPTAMEVGAVLEDTAIERERDGLFADATLNRQPRITQAPLIKPFYYHDDDWYEFAPYTSVAIYDRETGEEQALFDVPCPALELGNQDEAGNTYLSPWTFGPELALYGEGPQLCIRRITAEGALDEQWQPDLTQWTDGRPVKVFRYLRDGKALGTVLHYDEVTTDFSGGYAANEDVVGELEENWCLWIFDLDAETAQPVQGIDAMNSGFHWASFDDRTLLFLPHEGWGKTKVYELHATGEAELRFDAPGRLSEWLRVR